MCREFFKLADEPGAFNDDFFTNYWQEIYKSERGVVFVEMQENEPVAMLGCIACVDMCTGNLTMEECFFYSDPTKKTKAFKLVDMMEELGAKAGIKVFYLKRTAHLHKEILGKIYNRKGYVERYIRHEKVI